MCLHRDHIDSTDSVCTPVWGSIKFLEWYYSLMSEVGSRNSLDTIICSPFVTTDYRAWLYELVDYWEECVSISLFDFHQKWIASQTLRLTKHPMPFHILTTVILSATKFRLINFDFNTQATYLYGVVYKILGGSISDKIVPIDSCCFWSLQLKKGAVYIE